jgi:hypothetical protein
MRSSIAAAWNNYFAREFDNAVVPDHYVEKNLGGK